MEESSMQQCRFLLYSDEMMLAKAPKMLVDDGTMDNSTSSLKIFRKSPSKEMRVLERK
jgi:hypothetical protein